MSGIGARNMGHGLAVAELKFADGAVAPVASGDPQVYRVGNYLYLMDIAGILHPLVVGADGHGIVEVTVASSPYEVQETDRVLLVNTIGGPVQVVLPEDGGPFKGRPLQLLDAKRWFGTNACTLDGNGNNINGSATITLNQTDGGISVFWADPTWEQNVAGAGSSLLPHKSTHEEGGSDALSGTVAIQTLKASASVNLGGGASPGMTANFTKLFAALSAAGDHSGLGIVNEQGAIGLIRLLTAVGAPNIALDIITASLADSATLDYENGGRGGLMLVALPGTTGGQWGIVSFAQNGATSLAGLTFTEVTATLTTGSMFNIGASGGKVRFENLTGGTRDLIALAILRNPTVA